MQKPKPGNTWFFVDEAGDPTFFDKNGNLIVGQEGCSPILLLGFIETQNPEAMRRAVLDFRQQLAGESYFQEIPSFHASAVAFHAKDDAPEVRYLFYRLLQSLEFRAQFVVARKIERVFRNSFHSRPLEFYDHLVPHLFENVLHRYERNHVYFSKRGSRDRQRPLSQAIAGAVQQFETKWDVKIETTYAVQAQTPAGEPCLSVVDYMNWAVYRAYTARQMRFYRLVEDKVSLLVDLYDVDKYPNNWYSRKNPFEIEKATPL